MIITNSLFIYDKGRLRGPRRLSLRLLHDHSVQSGVDRDRGTHVRRLRPQVLLSVVRCARSVSLVPSRRSYK